MKKGELELPPGTLEQMRAEAPSLGFSKLGTPHPSIRLLAEQIERARAELAAAVALATPGKVAPPKPADPWQVDGDYSEPFASVDVVPEYIEAQAAFDLAAVQSVLDALVAP